MEIMEIILLVLGIAIMVSSVVIAFKIPAPTVFQLWVFRVFLSLGAASFGSILPGLLEIDVKWQEVAIRATGAIGFFVLVYLFNPPKDVVEFAQKNSEHAYQRND